MIDRIMKGLFMLLLGIILGYAWCYMAIQGGM